jgi:hypothetical protein
MPQLLLLLLLGVASCGGEALYESTADGSFECTPPPYGEWAVCGGMVHNCCGESYPPCPPGTEPGGACGAAGLCIDCSTGRNGQSFACSGGPAPHWADVSGSVLCSP